jgi:hypothetical protein
MTFGFPLDGMGSSFMVGTACEWIIRICFILSIPLEPVKCQTTIKTSAAFVGFGGLFFLNLKGEFAGKLFQVGEQFVGHHCRAHNAGSGMHPQHWRDTQDLHFLDI